MFPDCRFFLADFLPRSSILSSRGNNPVKTHSYRRVSQIEVKKDGVVFVKKPHQVKMIPRFYQIHLQQQLKETEYPTLKLLVYWLQCHKTVSIESLATLMMGLGL